LHWPFDLNIGLRSVYVARDRRDDAAVAIKRVSLDGEKEGVRTIVDMMCLSGACLFLLRLGSHFSARSHERFGQDVW
jgi:hypothetical protein